MTVNHRIIFALAHIFSTLTHKLYFMCSLGIFSYVVFWRGASPWYFALMILLDMLYQTYSVTEVKSRIQAKV